MPPIDSLKQQAFVNDYIRHTEWKMAQVREDTEFAMIHLPPSKDAEVDWSKIEDDIYYNKRINLKVLRYRANPKKPWTANDLKQSAFQHLNEGGRIEQLK